MKNTKKGFSLAEVLIATAIAAIIATIGFTIAKKGVARAYDLYVYAGYYGISQAVADAAIGKNFNIQDCGNNLSTGSCNFTKHVYKLLSGRNEKILINGIRKDIEFTTPNKIKYKIYKYGYRPNQFDQETTTVIEYRIMMEVPSVKTKNSNTKSICMSYQPNSVYKTMLIPFANDIRDTNCSQTNAIADISTRKDLLAFYLDDGYRGRKKDGVYQPRYFRNAKQTFCRVYDNKVLGGTKWASHINIIDCDGLESFDYKSFEVSDPSKIIIRITDPRRI